ncbi:MAG: SAM-dependent methyltransferase [Candidatus Aenigmatarchaeota archaeon]|nr:SAM-dependent methyltransferase [Candidatus Aenigmarchaeota archaeon]
MNLISIVYILIIVYLFKILIDLIRGQAIYFPLPKNTIRKMLKLAKVNRKDVLYDLGSGDGRVLRIAVKEFKVKKAIGIEKSLILFLISKILNKISKLEDKIEVKWKDFFKEDLSKATVITLYLNFGVMKKLEEKIIKECKNVRIVSAAHKFPNLKYKKKIKTGHFYCYLYEI